MKLIFGLILIVSTLASVATALTIDEYIALPAEEKIKVLREPPYDMLADLSKLSQLYTISIQDGSPKVQREGTRASFSFVLMIQDADEETRVDRLSEMSDEDSAALQEAWFTVLEHDDPAVRYAAAASLAYSAPPNPQIEEILLERIEVEDHEEIRVEIAKAAAGAGYNSERFVSLVLEMMHSEYNHRAAEALALLTPDTALDTLIELVGSKEASVRGNAVKVLAAYGRRAMRAKPALERLIKDQTIREDVHKLAARTLEAITLDKPQASNMKGIDVAYLWPLALPGSESADAQELNTNSPEADETNKPPSQIAYNQEQSKKGFRVGDSSDFPEELKKHKWIWLGALVLVIIAVWIVLKRRR